MSERIEFFATLSVHGKCISYDAEQAATVKLDADAQQYDELGRLGKVGLGTLLRVTAEVVKAHA